MASGFAKPELLSPAGDRTCLSAAVENGADAVYFGLQSHNARARAENFDLETLPEVMTYLHQRGVRGYVTLNTLVFSSELERVEEVIRGVAEAAADAVIVQDLGICRVIREAAPALEIHASTQMSISSAAGLRLAHELGCARVILARELSLEEIKRVRQDAPLPVEVFVHGALCVAYSGQCLTSEALGARSANRGECAQACRMPYTLVCDGRERDLGDLQYLLSPQDLAAYDSVPELVAAGVSSLKIEGRLKSPEYVASITRHYRRAIDEACAGRPVVWAREDVQEMAMTFSRGFSHGFLDGNDHKKLVRGDYAKKRGLFVGEVVAIHGRTARVRTDVAIQPGDGVVFDGNERNGVPEQGGRVFEARRSNNWIELGFDSRAVDLSRVVIGQRVWKTDDPVVSRRLKATFEGPPRRRVAIEVRAVARAGERLLLTATTADGRAAEAQSEGPLAVALNRPATAKLLHEQFDRLGQTVYELRSFIAEVEGEPLVPASVLNSTRRQLVERLDALAAPPPAPTGPPQVVPRLRNAMDRSAGHSPPEPTLIAFCRNTSQALSALDAGTNIIYLEYQHIKEYGDAVRQLRNASDSVTIYLAPPRIEKPGEAPIFAFLARQGSDGLLVRNAGSLEFCVERGIRFVADFSMNAANELTVDLLRRKGAERVTASYDLSFDQLMQLAQNGSPQSLEVVLHQHMPMFHMEHCVFCAVLSPGHDKTDCGRPCDHHDVRLRDRVGMEHPLLADVGCRNTLYNAVPQSAAEYLPRLLSLGVRHFRVEFLHDDSAAVRHVLHLYREAIAGRRDTARLWKELRANNRYGVTRGQLAIVE